MRTNARRFARGSVILGVGRGGFVDGIVLHQVLQWHHMLTATARHGANDLADLEANTFADGLFHSATWLIVVGGLLRVWSAPRSEPELPHSWRAVVGGLLFGWGAFNGVEGLVNHHLLGIHHVRDDVSDPVPWDVGFLALAVLLAAIGFIVSVRPSVSPDTANDERYDVGRPN